ncbi:MAG: 50S ribosomal protein L21 [Fibrobacteria bacterium]|nr:50S ribosomal protein L21 [Fibrobacteria bacterium]
MYSVIETGGVQYKVSLGESLKVPKIDSEVGSDIIISDVLVMVDNDDVQIGSPNLEEASVTVEVLRHGKEKKVKVFKKHRRKGYRRTYGHRQHFTEILIKLFQNGSAKSQVDDKIVTRAKARIKALIKKAETTAIKQAPASQEESKVGAKEN